MSLRSEESERDKVFIPGRCFLDGPICFTLTWARIYDTRLSTLVRSSKALDSEQGSWNLSVAFHVSISLLNIDDDNHPCTISTERHTVIQYEQRHG